MLVAMRNNVVHAISYQIRHIVKITTWDVVSNNQHAWHRCTIAKKISLSCNDHDIQATSPNSHFPGFVVPKNAAEKLLAITGAVSTYQLMLKLQADAYQAAATAQC